METGQISLKLNLSHNLYRVPDGAYEIHFSLYTEPQKGILIWTEKQEDVLIKNAKLKANIGVNRPVRNLLWAYQILFLEVDMKHKGEKIKFDHRFKLRYAVQPTTAKVGEH